MTSVRFPFGLVRATVPPGASTSARWVSRSPRTSAGKAYGGSRKARSNGPGWRTRAARVSARTTVARSVSPVRPRFSRTARMAAGVASTNRHEAAPLESASMPIAPVPANRSAHLAPGTRSPRLENRPSWPRPGHPEDTGSHRRRRAVRRRLDLDLEPGRTQCPDRVPVRMAVAAAPAPQRGDEVLDPPGPRPARSDVLVDPDLAAGPEDPPQLGQRPGGVGHRAQDVARHHGVERVVPERKVLGHTPKHGGGRPGPPGTAGGPPGHGRLGLDRHDPDAGPVQGEVDAGPRTDLQDRAPEPSDQLLAMLHLGSAAQPDDEVPGPGEDRMALHEWNSQSIESANRRSISARSSEWPASSGSEAISANASSRARRTRSVSSASRASRRSGSPDCRISNSVPSPRSRRSSSASSNPSVVRAMAPSRCRASSFSGADSSNRTQVDSCSLRLIRPRSWWSWARPNRS